MPDWRNARRQEDGHPSRRRSVCLSALWHARHVGNFTQESTGSARDARFSLVRARAGGRSRSLRRSLAPGSVHSIECRCVSSSTSGVRRVAQARRVLAEGSGKPPRRTGRPRGCGRPLAAAAAAGWQPAAQPDISRRDVRDQGSPGGSQRRQMPFPTWAGIRGSEPATSPLSHLRTASRSRLIGAAWVDQM